MTDVLKQDLFGFTDDEDKSLFSSSKGNFGLNQKAHITNFDVQKGEFGEFIQLDITVDEKEYSRRFYELGDTLKYKGKNYPKGSDEYNKVATMKRKDFSATMTHILKALGITPEAIKAALKNGATSFIDYFNKIKPLLPQNMKEIPVDVFLQYQYKIKEGQDVTFLELPYGMQDGYWISKHIEPVGEWKEEKTKDYIKYTDEAGNVHPLQKSKSFASSTKAERQEKVKATPKKDGEEELWV